MKEDLAALFAEAVEKKQIGPQYRYIRSVLERFLQEDAEFRPKRESFIASFVNDILSPLSRTAVIPGGSWARAAEGLISDGHQEVNIGVLTNKADIAESKISLEVGLPSAGPSVSVPPPDAFEALQPIEQFDIIVRAMPWVNMLAKNFVPDLLPTPPNTNLTPASLN